MKVWIVVSLMFLIENSHVKIAETTREGTRFFKTEKQCVNSLKNKMVEGEKLVEFFGGSFVTGGSVFQKVKQCAELSLSEKELKKFIRDMKKN